MKDLRDVSFLLDIQIYRDYSQNIFGLLQKSYIKKVLKRFDVYDYKLGDTPVAKGDKFSLHQYPKNDFEIKKNA